MQGGSERQSAHSGFAYLIVLVAVAVTSAIAASALQAGAALARRSAENELLAVGEDFRRALRSYAGLPATAAAGHAVNGPKSLQDLLRDPRQPGIVRHLRQVPADPLTGRFEWGLIEDSNHGIQGIYSLAPGKPIKQVGGAPGLENQAPDSYAAWVFSAGACEILLALKSVCAREAVRATPRQAAPDGP